MEPRGMKAVTVLKLGTVLACLCFVKDLVAQKDQSWTFNIPGVSFISFSPHYSNTQNQRISLSFRTRNPNGLIFCHYLKDLDLEELERLNYKLCVELQYGLLVLNYRLLQFQEDGLTVGQALHNDQWHVLDVFLNTSSGELTVAVDHSRRVATLNAYTKQDFSTLLDWSSHSSAVYFGGTDPDTLFSDIYPHFIGCMSRLRYETQAGQFMSIPVELMEGVVQGCQDKCDNDPCHHGGRCINMYTDTKCDCFGTDYQGPYCSDLGPTMITLRGYEWLTYSMYKDEENILTDRMRFSLQFKTSRSSGVLFYAVGGSPFHSHLTAFIHNSTVQVSVAFGDEDINFRIGLGVDNYRWHNLTIWHEGRMVHVYLDEQEQSKSIMGNIYHLGLDPTILIGGGNNFVVTRGLKVTQNFVGCLKNVYINEVSVLHQMSIGNLAVQYHGMGSTRPHYACEEVVNIPISFPTAASMLMIEPTQDMNYAFSIEFDFKTVRSEAILVHLSLVDRSTIQGQYIFGYVEVWVRKGQPYLLFAPSTSSPSIQNLSLPIVVNDNYWNTLQLTFETGQAKLKVNGLSVTTSDTGMDHDIMSKIVVGNGFNTYKESEGYVGCVRNLKLQGELLDALQMVEHDDAVGLIIDGCNITDYCRQNMICEHGGVCLSEWKGVACDCTDTDYKGNACHFPKYKRTCDEYFQSGVNNTGVMLVDIDGSGDLDPVHVMCEMGYESNMEFYGKTIVDHNLKDDTPIRKAMMRNLKKIISYRELNHEQLIRLTEESGECEQYIQYNCMHSPLRLGVLTWFHSASGEMVEYLGTGEFTPGFCTCSITQSCVNNQRCNCDNKTMIRTQDAGYNRVRHQLPLTQIVVEQDEDPLDPGSANITLGPLVCWGNRHQISDKSVTFSSAEGYLKSQPWQSGDLQLGFRTHQDSAILLYQSGTSLNINYLIVSVTSASTVKFFFKWGRKELEVDLHSPVPVNNGQWHQITIETDRYNVRCMLDMVEKIMEIPENVPKVTAFSGDLFIGGVPEWFTKDMVVADIGGIVGCMRGLYYNTFSYPLTGLIDSSTEHVLRKCMASCWPNPCQNGAECEEKWGSYQCNCVNKWAHSGYNCEIDINSDAVTFTGTPDSYLHFRKSVRSRLLQGSVVLSFRTLERYMLLLYVHDHMNNFLQVEVQEGRHIIAKFNRFNSILSQTKTLEGYVDDGEWHQVIIDNADGYIKVIVDVDNEPTRNSYRKQDLEVYSQTPFSSGELVQPLRPKDVPDPGINVYVGGVPEEMLRNTDRTRYSSLTGCLRGLKIGDVVFNLQEKAAKTTAVSSQCEDGCEDTPCKNGGICLEEWQDRKYTCDCSTSEYAGPTCNIESSGQFTGQSILQYKYSPTRETEETLSETLELIFRAETDSMDKMILAFIFSERYVTHDFLIVYLDPKYGVYLDTNQGYAIYGVGKTGQFADGRPHQLLYQHRKNEMILTVRSEGQRLYRNKTITVDEEGVGRVRVPDNALDDLDTIMLGGILNSQFSTIPDTSLYNKYSNFTGCISEVKFFPNQGISFGLRPMKDLREGFNTIGNVSTFGPEIKRCTIRDTVKTTTKMTTIPTFRPTENPAVSFPPWNPSPAETVFIGPTRITPLLPTPTNRTVATTTTAMETEKLYKARVGGNHDKIVAIALSFIAFLLIVAIIVAIVLMKIRRRERRRLRKKKEQQEFELKQPLNAAPTHESRQNQNYLARLDEFSMVSATLGSRPVRGDGMTTFKPQLSDSSYTYSSVPQTDDEVSSSIERRFYNHKKNRPASSISEVLEEMERQRNQPDADPADLETLGNGPLLSAPQHTSAPGVHEDKVLATDQVTEDSPSVSPPPPDLHEYNGDSGYEAESKPEEEEDEMDTGSFPNGRPYKGQLTPNTLDSPTFNVYSEDTPPYSPGMGSPVEQHLSSDMSPVLPPDTDDMFQVQKPYSDNNLTSDTLKTVIENAPEYTSYKPGVLPNGGHLGNV